MITFLTILFIIISIILAPFISFIAGLIAGQLIKVLLGPNIVAGLALIGFNLSLDKLPLFFGTLAVIASFFHSYTPSSSSKS